MSKQKNEKWRNRTFIRLLEYLKPFKYRLTLVIMTAVLGTAFSVISPKLLGNMTTILFEGSLNKLTDNPAAAGIDFGTMAKLMLILGVLYLLSSCLAYIQQRITVQISQQVAFALRKEIHNKLARLPLPYFDSRQNGDIMSRVTNDVETVSGSLQQLLAQIIVSLVTLFGIFAMMFFISPLLTFIVALTIPLSFWGSKQIISRSRKYFAAQMQTIGELNGHVEEMYSGLAIVRAYAQESKSIRLFQRKNEELYRSGWKAQFISGMIMPLLAVIGSFSYVIIGVVGAVLVIHRGVAVGDVQAFLQYSGQFMNPVQQVASLANVLQSTFAAADRIFELLDEEEEVPEKDNAKSIDTPSGNIAFRDVSFGYDRNKPLIQGFNVDIHQGQTVAIVGPTGAGKTTLANLLLRFYDINGGVIRVDGIDISELKRKELRRMFGVVLQDPWLFTGTIRENIAYGRTDASDEDILRAAKAAYVDHFIRTLPEGYETMLNEESTNISHGQKQLLTIARAFLSDPAMLILDEATSNVDTRTELLIQQAMTRLMKGRTSLVIAHRLSTIQNADLILVMDHGNISEKGTHNELLSKKGFYSKLYRA